MEKVLWKVDGMTCANCALSINKTLQKQGMMNISVNALSGDVSFDIAGDAQNVLEAKRKVESLGYKVSKTEAQVETLEPKSQRSLSKYMVRFLVSLPFTLLLLLHMIPSLQWHWLMQPWVQFALALPVFIIGMEYFGVSAVKSIRSGVPNMNVLIAMGALAAFSYSTWGLFQPRPEEFLFFETAASIVTIVFFGYWLEDISVARTQRTIKQLSKQQVVVANMLTYDAEGNENVFVIENTALQVGDLILIKTGEQVPADCKILSGEAEVNEALLTGESLPLIKRPGDIAIGGSVVVSGNIKAYVNAVGNQTVMSNIVALMKKAQTEKPPVQQLADRISAVFVPLVLVIALITLFANMWWAQLPFRDSLIRAVAVLVIACPCAMGLATPAAIAVGLGRAAKNGILFTDVKRMELFRNVKRIVFDKTGTLTTGRFQISSYRFFPPVDSSEFPSSDEDFRKLVFSLEKYSAHPIAKSIANEWKRKDALRWQTIEELKGRGVTATANDGNTYAIGSASLAPSHAPVGHSLYVTKNQRLIGWLDISDEIRPEASEVIAFCKLRGIEPIMLSGDTPEKCQSVASTLGIEKVVAGQTPAAKLAHIEKWSREMPTVMVGDGINDAPAMAKATLSVSLAEAAQLAVQSASVVLTDGGLKKLPKAILLGKYTYGTVKSNLFWAFSYNIVAIPVAAMGYLHPAFAALIMGASDVILALNSLRLGVRKLDG